MDIHINNSKLLLTDRNCLNLGERWRYRESYSFYQKEGSTILRTLKDIDGIKAQGFRLVMTQNMYSGEKYSQEEIDILKKALLITSKKRNLDVAETICLALGDPRITAAFRKVIFDDDNNHLYAQFVQKVLWGNKEEPEQEQTFGEEIFCRQYKPGNRYNILDLSKDLVWYKCKIFTDPEIVEKYTKISRGVSIIEHERSSYWGQILKTKMNMERANLNLQYTIKVKVDIPENDFGVPAEPMECDMVRSLCLVCDGVLWTKEIIVQCDDKKFIKKLKSVPGLVKYPFIYRDEVVLDLTKIPIVKRSDLRNVTDYALDKAEYMRLKAQLGARYCRYISEKEVKTESPKDRFLAKLGIFGNSYYAPRSMGEKVRDYESTELHTVISLGKILSSSRAIEKFVNNGSCGFIKGDEILNSIKNSGKTENEWKKEIMEYGERVGELKFRLLMGKHMKFDQKKQPRVGMYSTYGGLNFKLTTKVKKSVASTE